MVKVHSAQKVDRKETRYCNTKTPTKTPTKNTLLELKLYSDPRIHWLNYSSVNELPNFRTPICAKISGR